MPLRTIIKYTKLAFLTHLIIALYLLLRSIVTISTIVGKSAMQWVVAVPQLTILENRQLVWEISEKDGGRLLMLVKKNRQLLTAKDL
jgi:hypothetical protein